MTENRPEALRNELVALLTDFQKNLESDNIRSKVIALIPAYQLLRRLGASLIPRSSDLAARDRILLYLRKYPRVIIRGEEIMVVAGIGEWARRLRELRVQFGWSIVNGITAKEMEQEHEFPLSVDVSHMGPEDYILLDEREDREAAHRWNEANSIRKSKGSVRDRILQFLKANVGHPVTGEELRYVAGNRTEWARRVRELRTEHGWPIATKNTSRPDLPVGAYVLESLRQSPAHDRNIPDDVRGEVLRRDNYKCQNCGWSRSEWDPSDPRHLELHHKKPHAKGGENSEENLTTLCTVCHDKLHRTLRGKG